MNRLPVNSIRNETLLLKKHHACKVVSFFKPRQRQPAPEVVLSGGGDVEARTTIHH
jgi:hypothetical protein